MTSPNNNICLLKKKLNSFKYHWIQTPIVQFGPNERKPKSKYWRKQSKQTNKQTNKHLFIFKEIPIRFKCNKLEPKKFTILNLAVFLFCRNSKFKRRKTNSNFTIFFFVKEAKQIFENLLKSKRLQKNTLCDFNLNSFLWSRFFFYRIHFFDCYYLLAN